jgi:transcriptional regulator GlxA family with amidase domain
MRLDLPDADAPRISRSLASWQLNRVLELFETNIHRPLRIGAVANAVRLSVSHFSRTFRRSVGGCTGGRE